MSVGANFKSGDVAVTPVIERLQLSLKCVIHFTEG